MESYEALTKGYRLMSQATQLKSKELQTDPTATAKAEEKVWHSVSPLAIIVNCEPKLAHKPSVKAQQPKPFIKQISSKLFN